MVTIVQTLVYFVSNLKYPKWVRGDFTALSLSQALFTVTGVIISFLSVVASDDIEDQSGKHIARSNSAGFSVALLVSSLIAGGIGAFNIAAMNYTTYGLPALLVASIVRTLNS